MHAVNKTVFSFSFLFFFEIIARLFFFFFLMALSKDGGGGGQVRRSVCGADAEWLQTNWENWEQTLKETRTPPHPSNQSLQVGESEGLGCVHPRRYSDM